MLGWGFRRQGVRLQGGQAGQGVSNLPGAASPRKEFRLGERTCLKMKV